MKISSQSTIYVEQKFRNLFSFHMFVASRSILGVILERYSFSSTSRTQETLLTVPHHLLLVEPEVVNHF
jgi:hypothetical protein